MRALAEINAQDSTGVTVGYWSLVQDAPGQPTIITYSVAGTIGSPTSDFGEYHIHEYPISSTTEKCSPASVGGHYGADAPGIQYPCVNKPYGCEIGDLSGKFGNLASSRVVNAEVVDPTIDLATLFATGDKSIVIHDANGERWACGTLSLRSGGASNVVVPATPVVSPSTPCRDANTLCSAWATSGFCTNAETRQLCGLSCAQANECGPSRGRRAFDGVKNENGVLVDSRGRQIPSASQFITPKAETKFPVATVAGSACAGLVFVAALVMIVLRRRQGAVEEVVAEASITEAVAV
jgi:Cu/Zn superoxide dismutase